MTGDRAPGQEGFTVVEVLVALAVALTALGGVVTARRIVAQGTGRAAHLSEASSVAGAALEEIRRLRWAQLESRFGAAPIDVELPAATGEGRRLYARHLRVDPLPQVSASLFRVRVEVSWAEEGAALGEGDDHTLALETLRTRQEAM